MSEPSSESGDPKGGFSRWIAIVLVLVGVLWVTLSLREAPTPTPETQALSDTATTPGAIEAKPPATPERALLDTTQADDVLEREDIQPAPVETGPDPEELERREAMARRLASVNQDPVKVLVNDAQRLLDEGRNDEAIERARQAMLKRKSPAAYAIETRAYCAKGDADRARRAFKRVLGNQREPTLAACKERGISLVEP